MKRWFLLALMPLVLLVVAASIFVVRTRFAVATPVPMAKFHLLRVPNSAYKYHLCTEAYSFAIAPVDNPYKTDQTFRDPFRHADDTIIPRFLGFDPQTNAVSFSVKIIIGQIATFNETIRHIHGEDGIAILIP